MSLPEIQTLSQLFTPALLGILIRSSVMIAAGALLTLLFGRRTADLRHLVCHGVLYAALLLPAVEYVAPPLRHPSAAFTEAKLALFPAQPATFATVGTTPKASPALASTTAHSHRFLWMLVASGLYLSVGFALLFRLALNLLRLKHLADRSEAILDRSLKKLADEIWLPDLSRRKPRIRASKEIRIPMALGIRQATVLLPASWRLWSEEKLRAVLIHEMAHARRGDPRTAFLASVAVSLFWPNPLIYWLRRKLAALAEEACDEAALVHLKPENYARILIDFAAEAGRQGSRLAAASSVAVRGPLIKKRLERIFSIHRDAQPSRPLLRASLIAALIPALYFAASARFDQQSAGDATQQSSPLRMSQKQIETLKTKLLSDPENLKVRGTLMMSYAFEHNEDAFTRQMLWVIQHHPEARIAGMPFYSRLSLQDRGLIRLAWEHALASYPNSSKVIFHAGLFLSKDEPERALNLYKEAESLTPADSPLQTRYVYAAAVIYAAAVSADLKSGTEIDGIAINPGLASELHNDIQSSSDPGLVSQVGAILVPFEHQEALSLLKKAVRLDPENLKWKKALQSAETEPIRSQKMQRLTAGLPGPVVRIGLKVAERELVKKVAPKYPPQALAARLSGTVEFGVVIGKDGKVRRLTLLWGHPILVNAAKNAVLQYVYRPTLLNGHPVAVATTVKVQFRLPQG